MPKWLIQVSDEMDKAARAKAGNSLADYIRRLVAKDCKDKTLATVRKPGRPKNTNKGE